MRVYIIPRKPLLKKLFLLIAVLLLLSLWVGSLVGAEEETAVQTEWLEVSLPLEGEPLSTETQRP